LATFVALPEGTDFTIHNIPFGSSSVIGNQFPSSRIGLRERGEIYILKSNYQVTL